MSENKNDEHKNFIEAKMIIQEFHDEDEEDVFVVGTAPFGKLWFDNEKVTKQYKVLTDSWYEEYGDKETKHSKRPRIVSILIDESDAMFNKYRNKIREAQEQNTESVGKEDIETKKDNLNTKNTIELSENKPQNLIVETSTSDSIDEKPKKPKRTYKKKVKEPVVDSETSIEKAFQGKQSKKKVNSNKTD